MCCLTIVRTHNHNIVITHNRDEQWSRQINGELVSVHMVQERKIWMPKDSLSKGTWIGTDGIKAAAILNGFKENHIKKAKYRVSRGTIIPAFLSSENTNDFVASFDPTGLEPFTLVLVDNKSNFLEYGWDEKDIHLHDHSFETPAMYSSATLYNSDIQQRRKSRFHYFTQSQVDFDDLWRFHENKGEDHGNFINVDFNAEISTVAISQIVLGNASVFHYQSLLNQNQKQTIILNNEQ